MKKRILSLKIHLWASLAINMFVFIILHRVSTEPAYILGLLLLFLLFFVRGLIKTSYDMDVGDTSMLSLMFDYLCVIIVSCIFAIRIYENCSNIFFIIYVSIILLEILAAVLIICWNKIIHIFKKRKSK